MILIGMFAPRFGGAPPGHDCSPYTPPAATGADFNLQAPPDTIGATGATYHICREVQ